MKKMEFDVVIERDADGLLVASVPALPGCHTQANSFDTLQVRITEAIQLCLEEYGSETELPQFVGIQRVAIEARVPVLPDSLAGIS